jgi:hypothetical protein
MATSYKDPLYDQLDAKYAAQVGVPEWLMVGIRTNGERTNADQVSSAKARTVNQFTPETRDLVIKKYGVDPWESPETSTLGKAYLLKESLDRNGQDPAAAAREYVGGTNPANHGPTTRAYVNRVMVNRPKDAATPAGAPATSTATGGRSLRAELAASQPQAPSIAKIYDAYQSGKMSPEQEKEFEADVNAGSILLPRKASLKVKDTSNIVPDAVIEAYVGGKMSPEQVAEYEADLASGAIKLPEGITHTPQEKPGMMARIKDVVTGDLRGTYDTATLPEWTTMPELNQLSAASAKSGMGTMFAPSGEIPQILQAQFPGVTVRKDEQGNNILKSSVDGKEYAIPPGLTMGDLPRVMGAVGVFTPAGRATTLPGMAASGAATQAVIEGSQAATGGEFNPTEVVMASAAGPVASLVARGVGGTVSAVQRALQKSGAEIPVTQPGGVQIAANQVPAPIEQQTAKALVPEVPVTAPTPAVAEMAPEQLASVAKKAATGTFGKQGATEELAAQAMPNKAVTEAAERLKMELDPDFVTDNDQFRKLVGLTRSQAGSEAEARGIKVAADASEKAEEALDALGASRDIAAVSDKVKTALAATRDDLEKASDALYREVDDALPKSTPVQMPSLRARLDKVIEDMGGVEGLSTQEKQLAKMLDEPVTYARLARERGLIGKALAGKESPYGSMEEGSLKQLYKAMAEDQLDAVTTVGGDALRDKYRLASQLVAKRKALEKRIVESFGKDSGGSLVPALRNGIANAVKGDDRGLGRLLKVIPEPQRKEALSSALLNYATSTTKGGQFGFQQYAKMYQGMRQNSPVYASIVNTLGDGADELLTDLYKVSQSIAKAQQSVLHTGKANQVFQGPETLVGKVLDGATSAAVRGVATEAATSMAFGPTGAGFLGGALQSLASGKKDALKAVGELLTSPEFKEIVQQSASRGFASNKSVERLARARAMRGYSSILGGSFKRDVSEREAWIRAALQSSSRSKDREQSIAGQGATL